MVMVKKKCLRCSNYVLTNHRSGYVICYECQEKQMQGEIKDPEMKKMFDIPLQFYKDSTFLRDIKIKYLQYGSLSERQIAAFKSTVEKFETTAKLRSASSSDEGQSENE